MQLVGLMVGNIEEEEEEEEEGERALTLPRCCLGLQSTASGPLSWDLSSLHNLSRSVRFQSSVLFFPAVTKALFDDH